MNPGDQLGHYQIIAPLGAGGMGEVYRARDTMLDREVAIKVLPARMAADGERLERFRREALSVAALNHPNIVTIHSVEHDGDTHFITLEYVNGRTLDAIVGPGGLSIDGFFEVAIPLTDAIAAAHARGIAHRDLKPGNVMVSAEGRVKVLDFGLAKLLEAPADADAATQLASAQHLTEEGKVLGTVAYMSPEQAEGKDVDHRSDVFSLGILLYEMATGGRPFTGDTKLSVLSSIVRDEPTSITELNRRLPRHLGRIVKKALEKDPARRYQTMLDVRNDLAELKEEIDSGELLVTGALVADPAALSGRGRSRGTTWALGVGAVIVVLSLGQLLWSTFGVGGGDVGAPTVAPTVSVVPLTAATEADIGATISPDGEWVAFARFQDPGADIFLQSVGSSNALQITDGVPAFFPAFSPDGTQIAFSSEPAGIYTMSRTGDRVRQLTDRGHNPAWSPDGTKIAFGNEPVFTRPYVRGAMQNHLGIVDVATGEVTEIAVADGVQPHWSPNGERIAYWASTNGQRDIWTVSAGGGEPVAVTQDVYHDYSPAWSPDGEWLFFASDRSGSMAVWRVRLDLLSGDPQGDPQQITTGGSGTLGMLSLAADGKRLVYTDAQFRSKLLAAPFDAERAVLGADTVTLAEGARMLVELTVSADGEWLAYRNDGPTQDVYVVGAEGGREFQTTEGIAKDWFPALSPDGARVAYYSNASGNYEIWVADRDGSNPLRLTDDPEQAASAWTPRWSPDGERISYYRTGAGTFIVDADTPYDQQQEVAIPNQPGVELAFRVSDWHPDGRRLLGFQGPVRSYDLETGEYTVLWEQGGAFPRWMADGRILLGYPRRSSIVDPETGTSLEIEGPELPLYLTLSPDDTRAYYLEVTFESHIWLMEIEEGR